MKSQPAADGHGKPKKLYQQLYVQVLFGVCLGIFVGHFWPEFGAAMKPFGDLFVKLVKMMIPPVVFCTITSGIYSMADNKEIGKTLLKAMGLFYVLTIIALITGLIAVYALRPGVGLNIDPASIDPAVAAQYTKQVHSMGFVEFIIHIVPNTFFAAFTDGEVLPVLLLAILVGFGLTRVGAAGDPVKKAIDSFSVVLFSIFNFLMRLAPLGAFGGMAFTVGRYGIKSIGSLGMLIVTFYVACGFFVFVILNLLARVHGFSLLKLLRFTKEELLIVLGTSSTEPVLPRLLYKLERLGCKRGVVGLVLPAGYSFNLDGTAIYLTLASVFITQAMNIDLSWGQVLGMLLVMLLTSKGAAGVTGSGFVALVATLTIFPEVPVVGVAIIVGVDRFMSEARALTSMVSNTVADVVVSIWEHACNREVLQRELDNNHAQAEDALEEPQVADARLTTGRV
jgi:aerobic C4-dicarboxylate transport protein